VTTHTESVIPIDEHVPVPLLAHVDGVPTVSSLLSDEDWRALQADLRAGRRSVRLPYCDTPAYLRTSKLGVRHFAHRNLSDCPEHPKETGQHLLAKNIIMQAARTLGWQVETEARRDGWVADVLASTGERTVAFEVQWSAQARTEFERRQARYTADGVDGVWFTRYQRSVPYPRRDLPIFQMIFAEDGVHAVVNDTTMALTEAVTALLEHRIGFRDHVATGRPATMHVACFEYPCYRCDAISMIWNVVRESMDGPCGTTVDLTAGTIWAKVRPEASAQVRQHMAAEATRIGVPLANLGPRYSRTASGSYTAFSCPRCDALFGDWFLHSYMIEARGMDAQLDLQLPHGRVRIPKPHWCVDLGSGLCVDLPE
jgi:competence protein CoiA